MIQIKISIPLFFIIYMLTTAKAQEPEPLFKRAVVLNETGYPYYFKELKINGYAGLYLRSTKAYKNIVYPERIRKAKDTAIGEISAVSLENPNITEKIYLLVLNYKSNNPIVFINETNTLRFHSKPIISERKNKHIIKIKTQKGFLEVLIDFEKQLNKVNNYIGEGDSTTILSSKYAIPIWLRSIRYGAFISKKDTTYFAISDENQNGIFNEFKHDRIAISNGKDIPYFELYETSSSTMLNNTTTLYINNIYYRVESVNNDGSAIYIEPVNATNGVSLKVFNELTDATFINSYGSLSKLKDVLTENKYNLIYCWIKRCTECERDLIKIDSISLKYRDKLNTLCLLDKSNTVELNNTVNKLKLVSNHGTGNLEVSRDLHVSGYPTILLFDKDRKLLKKINNLSEIEKLIEN